MCKLLEQRCGQFSSRGRLPEYGGQEVGPLSTYEHTGLVRISAATISVLNG
jgi:hypothetical protein